MHFRFTSLVSGLSLCSGVVAAVTTQSFVTCITKNGPKSTSTVKTTSHILTIPFYGFKVTTITPIRVITPSPTTTTITASQTSTVTLTLAQETDTFSTTTTSTDTIFTTSTDISSTTTFVTTTITDSPTTTIAAPADFTPIKSTFPNSAKRGLASRPQKAPVEHALEERAKQRGQVSVKNGKITCSPAIYPTAVTCAGIVKVITTSTITKTAKTKTVTGPTPTSSVTTTTTATITTTLTPIRASTTLSFSESITVTETQVQSSTTTITSTQTVEVVVPSATYYAACAPENIVSSINNQGISNGFYDLVGGDSIQRLTAASPYDCCVTCVTTANCGGTFYINGQCVIEIQTEGVCSQANQAFDLVLSPGTLAFVSNGLCGQMGLK